MFLRRAFFVFTLALSYPSAVSSQSADTPEKTDIQTPDTQEKSEAEAGFPEHSQMLDQNGENEKAKPKALAKDMDIFFDEIETDAENGELEYGCTAPENVA